MMDYDWFSVAQRNAWHAFREHLREIEISLHMERLLG